MNRLVGCTGFTVTIAVAAGCCGTGRAATSVGAGGAGAALEVAVWPRGAAAGAACWAGWATTGAAGRAPGRCTTWPFCRPDVAVVVCAGGRVADGGGNAATVAPVEALAPGGGGRESLAMEVRGTAAATWVSFAAGPRSMAAFR